MTDRIRYLREQSLNAVNHITAERALLVTELYKSRMVQEVSIPVLRAMTLEYILKYKHIYINEGELIVGERGPAPKACPTYPEICVHSLEDLDILDSRKKVSFKIDEETKKVYEEKIIPFWNGNSNRDRIMQSMEPEWLDAYKAGVFTEFQEQRAPGHTVAGGKIYQKGMLDLIEEIRDARTKIPDTRCQMPDKNQVSGIRHPASVEIEELTAMEIAANAIILFANRYAEALEEEAMRHEARAMRDEGPETRDEGQISKIENRKSEIKELARICRRVPAHAPETFHEALQHYWFIHLGVITELNPWDSFNPGRLDQNLYPFYKRELEAGTLTRERAKELLQSFWIKFNNHPAPPKVGVTALESNTYTDFTLINLGGVRSDGSDAVNELTFLILDVIEEMRLLQPSSMVQVSRKNPDNLIKRSLQITKTGFGQPSYFNTDAIVQELVRQGKRVEDARNGGASGCVEAGAFGTEAYILSGYFNLAKILELTLHNGFDPLTRKQIGPASGDPASFISFDELMTAYRTQLNHFIGIKIRGNDTIHRIFADHMPAPFLSLIIDDCIANGKDYNAGGARYNTTYIQGVGLGSLTDSLTALKYHVFDQKIISMTGFLDALEQNFRDYDEFRVALIYNTPKYGNDNDYADAQATRVFELFFEAVDGHPTSIGGIHRINMLPTTSHVYFGSVIGALPDGRKARQPLSEGISPVQGADTNGPTAVLKSASKIDHLRTGGTLLNQKFSPEFFDGEEAVEKLTALIRSYFRMNGHHIQFNVVSAATLRDAQKHPEKYRDLIVRVAGYSDYFNDLGEDLQNEIIRRTEHT
ncbi:MAG: glycyl radical protein [Bacteroidetes bacterium]|nr:MAG: glycyl radical protein [Bacteroidota bacterium]